MKAVAEPLLPLTRNTAGDFITGMDNTTRYSVGDRPRRDADRTHPGRPGRAYGPAQASGGLSHLQALADLPAYLGIGEIVADERRTHRPPQFLDRPVRGVLGTAAGEAPQRLLGLRRPQNCQLMPA
ncbi:hypothetical protein GCM10027074_37100 [Streptomyces deserti]